MADLPPPLTNPQVDLRGMPYMPLELHRLFESDFYALATGDEFKAALTLWGKSFYQIPAGSLPSDERLLAHLSGAKCWAEVKKMAMHGWVKCADGRLYHATVAEKVVEAWEARLQRRARTKAARAAKLKPHVDGEHADGEQPDREREDLAECAPEFGAAPATARGTEFGAVPVTEFGAVPVTEFGAVPVTEFGAVPVTEFGAARGTEFGAVPVTEFGAVPVTEFGAVPVTEFGAVPVTEFGAVPVTRFDAVPVTRFGAVPVTGSKGTEQNRREQNRREQNREDKKAKTQTSVMTRQDEADGFEQFWQIYPRRVGKGQARRAFSAALGKVSLASLLASLRGYAFDPRERFQPHPATWLNGERWLDEAPYHDPVLRAAGVGSDIEKNADAMMSLLQ